MFKKCELFLFTVNKNTTHIINSHPINACFRFDNCSSLSNYGTIAIKIPIQICKKLAFIYGNTLRGVWGVT